MFFGQEWDLLKLGGSEWDIGLVDCDINVGGVNIFYVLKILPASKFLESTMVETIFPCTLLLVTNLNY